MKNNRFFLVLTAINVSVFGALVFQLVPVEAQEDVAQVVRAQAIELLDEYGQVRAQLNVEEGGDAVFRIRDSKGEIRVKIGGSEKGSGLVLINDQTEAAVHILAQPEVTTLTLRDMAGGERVITP